MTTSSLRRSALTIVLVASCTHPAATPGGSASATAAQPTSAANPPSQGTGRGALASLASQPLIVLPVQSMRLSVPDWSDQVGDPRAYQAKVDDEIAFAVRERGLRASWAFPPDLARSARRNPGYAADPYTIALEPLAAVERDPDKLIAEPLAGQLRGLASLAGARFALIPVELRLAPDPAGARAVLHLVLVDVRQAKLTWKADIVGTPVRAFSPAVAADLAGHVADLFTTAR